MWTARWHCTGSAVSIVEDSSGEDGEATVFRRLDTPGALRPVCRPLCRRNRAGGFVPGPDAHLSRFRKTGRRPRSQGPGAARARRKGDAVAIGDEIARLEAKAGKALADIYAKLTPWQKTQVARHPDRPHFRDYVNALVEDFTPLAGDRQFGEDAAIVGGFGRFRGRSVCVIGQEKGSDTESRIKHNFGMARPEGYRKAVRAHGARRPFRPAGACPGRHRRRLSRHRRRGARPGRGDRPLDRRLPDARRARSSPSSSARAAPAAPSRSPPPTAC